MLVKMLLSRWVLFFCLLLPCLAGAESHFEFRQPHPVKYIVEDEVFGDAAAQSIKVRPAGETNFVYLDSRVVLELRSPKELSNIVKRSSLTLARQVATNLFILQAPNARVAMLEAQRIGQLPDVSACYPVARWPADLQGAYAPLPNDFYFGLQNNMENRTIDGKRLGCDLNARGGWALSRGVGTTIAIADLGIEATHKDLQSRMGPADLHHNFVDGSTNTGPAFGVSAWAHATAAAGLAAAEQNNGRGMSGVAPEAQLASWVIFDTNLVLASEEKLMDMYQFKSNSITVQNHSWSRAGITFKPQGLLEKNAVENAVRLGRNGLGVVMVRAAGNDREILASCDDDATVSDPRAIAVAAVFADGRPVNYSEPGASVLVAAPSGENGSNLFTADLTGTRGANQLTYGPPNTELNDYIYYSLGFSGTSASAPQVAGTVALMLSANPNLSYRDVQQILALSSAHFYTQDPDLTLNGAGLLVSHNAGYGIPDAGWAVRLSKTWTARPPHTNVTVDVTNSLAIPDGGLRALFTGSGLPANLLSVAAAPGWGLHPESPTAVLPLVDVGVANSVISTNLTNKAALIRRESTSSAFQAKISNAAKAGAAFAIVYNDSTNNLAAMPGTQFAPIPAVLIQKSDADALRSHMQSNTVSAQLRLFTTGLTFNVSQTLLCEHVGLKLTANHPIRGDLRVMLTSPSGTRSVLQRFNQDANSGPNGWTYWSTHHFFESSAGTWTLSVADEFETDAGSIEAAELTILGTPITDTDADGLDDAWETAYFSGLTRTSKEDTDKDGYSNGREQMMGTDPNVAEPLQIDLSRWNASLARFSWPGNTNFTYEVWSGTNIAAMSLATNMTGQFPEMEWLTSYTDAQRFVRIIAQPLP